MSDVHQLPLRVRRDDAIGVRIVEIAVGQREAGIGEFVPNRIRSEVNSAGYIAAAEMHFPPPRVGVRGMV